MIGRLVIPADVPDEADRCEEPGQSFRLGGFGAIDYCGQGNRYVLVPDRGPDDGSNEFRCRMHEAEITVVPGGTPPLSLRWLTTRLLRDETGAPLVGTASVHDVRRPDGGRRFDPEGVRATGDRLFVSDEYGPQIVEFDRLGRRRRLFPVPEYYRVERPSADRGEELKTNSRGRIPNRGLESLALSTDGQRLYGVMQSALIQDASPGELGRLYGRHTRILEIDLRSGATRQFAYPLADVRHGVSDLVAVGAAEFLAIERDDQAGVNARYKRIVRIDLAKATDIGRFERLPSDALPPGTRAAAREDFIDLLDPRFGLAGEQLPEKFEGLTVGPRLADGRQLLIVSVDNDFRLDLPSMLIAFAIPPADLPALKRHPLATTASTSRTGAVSTPPVPESGRSER